MFSTWDFMITKTSMQSTYTLSDAGSSFTRPVEIISTHGVIFLFSVFVFNSICHQAISIPTLLFPSHCLPTHHNWNSCRFEEKQRNLVKILNEFFSRFERFLYQFPSSCKTCLMLKHYLDLWVVIVQKYELGI